MLFLLILAVFYSFTAQAAVNDVMPGDYYPLLPGQSTATLYAYDRTLQGPYANGGKIFNGSIDSKALALRTVRAFQFGDTTVAGVAVLPWSRAAVSPAPLATALGQSAAGLGDLRLGFTAWVINDKANANYLGLSGMLIMPTGEYDRRQVINIGENRLRLILSGGWQKDLTPKLLIELSPEIVFCGDNDNYAVNRRLEQKTSHALTGYLRYRAMPAWHVHVGGQLNRGGETRINGVNQNNPANNNRVMAGLSWFLPEQQQLILRLARDITLDNGFKTRIEVAFRYQKVF